VLVAELPPVPQVDHRGTGDVVGVERALRPGVRLRVVGAAADALVLAAGAAVGVRPQHAERWLLREPVRRVPRLPRRGHLVVQEVEVRQVGQPAVGSGRVRDRAGRDRRDAGQGQ